MSRIAIDLDQLALALGDHSSEWVLDRRTGEILMASWLEDSELWDDIQASLSERAVPLDEGVDPLDDDRFVTIQPIASHEGFRWMERFAEGQEDPRVREALLDALDRPKPFQRFKAALSRFPEVRERWYEYENDKSIHEARAWLALNEIDADLSPPPPAAGAS